MSLHTPPAAIPLPRLALDAIQHHLGNGGMAAGGLVELVLRAHRGELAPAGVVLLMGARQSLKRISALTRALTEDLRCRDCPWRDEP